MSSLIVEVHSTEVDHRKGVSKGSGKEWEMFNQTAWMRKKDEPYPEKVQISLKDERPINPGMYSLDPAKVVKVGGFGSIEIDDRMIQDALKFEKELPKQAS